MSSLLLVICSVSVAICCWQVSDASSRGSVTSDVSCSDVASVVSVFFVCCVRWVPYSMSWFRSIGCSLILSLFCVVSIIWALLYVVLSAGCNLSEFLIFLRRFWGRWLQSTRMLLAIWGVVWSAFVCGGMSDIYVQCLRSHNMWWAAHHMIRTLSVPLLLSVMVYVVSVSLLSVKCHFDGVSVCPRPHLILDIQNLSERG
jgi:hypothetical protein